MAHTRKRSRAQSGAGAQLGRASEANLQHTIPGLGRHFSPAASSLPMITPPVPPVPIPPPPQFMSQNGQLPAITVEQLHAYAATLPLDIWRHFPAGLPPVSNGSTSIARLPTTNALQQNPQVADIQSSTASSLEANGSHVVRSDSTSNAKVTNTADYIKTQGQPKKSKKKNAKDTKADKASKKLQSASNMADSTIHVPQTTSAGNHQAGVPAAHGVTLQERAIVVLRELHAKGIDYEDVLRLGIAGDEIVLLRELYQAAGIHAAANQKPSTGTLSVKYSVSNTDDPYRPFPKDDTALLSGSSRSAEAQHAAPTQSQLPPAKPKPTAQTLQTRSTQNAKPPDRQAYLAKLEAARAKPSVHPTQVPASSAVIHEIAIATDSTTPESSLGPTPSLILDNDAGSTHAKKGANLGAGQSVNKAGVGAASLAVEAANQPVSRSSNALTQKLRERLAALKQKRAVQAVDVVQSPAQDLGHPLTGQSTEFVLPRPGRVSPIPGLLMSPFPASTAVGQTEQPAISESSDTILSSADRTTSSQLMVKKRPVAADFLSTTSPPSKRPASMDRISSASSMRAHSDKVVVDLSQEGSSVSDDMDLESNNDGTEQHFLNAQPERQVINGTPSHALQTRTASPRSAAAQRLLEAREKAIMAMRQRIKAREEAQQRKAEVELSSAQAIIDTPKKLTAAATRTVASVLESSTPAVSNQTAGSLQVRTSVSPHLSERQELRRRREAEIDAGISSNNSRLEQLQLEMQRLMAANQKATEDKDRLAQELEDAGINTAGMSHEQMQSTKDIIENAQSLNVDSTSSSKSPVPNTKVDIGTTVNDSTIVMEHSREVDTQHNLDVATLPDTQNHESEKAVVLMNLNSPQLQSQTALSSVAQDEVISLPETTASQSEGRSNMEVEEVGLSDATSLGSSSIESGEIDEADGIDSDEQKTSSADHEKLGRQEQSPFPVGLSGRSLRKATTHVDNTMTENVVPPDGTITDDPEQVDSADDYDPADLLADVATDYTDANVASTPQPSNDSIAKSSLHELGTVPPHSHEETEIAKPIYVPYQSPLAMFKAYRFHPEYKDKVLGGFASNTYSSTIDDDTPMCPSELGSSQCTDPDCQFQHFRTIEMNDGEILKELGIDYPFSDKSRLEEWKEGIRIMLQDIRTLGAADVDAIATKLLEFRRSFIGDHTRILSLDD